MESITDWFMWIIAGIIIVYDIYVIKKDGAKSSVSVRLVTLSKRYLIIPFIIGVLIGHFYFPLYAGCN